MAEPPLGSVDLDRDAGSHPPPVAGRRGPPLAARVMGWEVGRDTNDFVKKENPTKENGMHKENTVASQRQNGDVYMWYGKESFSMGRSDQKIQAGQELGRHVEEEEHLWAVFLQTKQCTG